MNSNTLFALALGCCLLRMTSSILIVESAGVASIAVPAITLATGSIAVPSTAAAASALAGVGALAAAGLIVAAKAAGGTHKRSAPSCMPVNNPELFFTLAANSDKLGCGMRLVCELEATPDEKLSHEEKLILGLFGRSPSPVQFEELNTPKAGFQYAAFVGAKASSPADCATVFNACPFDRATMIEAFQRSGTNAL